MLRPFALHRPGTAEEACALLATLGEDAAPYAGGTELLLLMKLGLLRPPHLVDVKRIAGFGDIADGTRLTIGATVTHRTLERSPLVRARCPLVASVARHVANVRVRNVGTVGGNLAFADPHSDLATLFLTLDATVELVSPRGRRELSLAEFVRGPWETARRPDELLASVRLAPAAPSRRRPSRTRWSRDGQRAGARAHSRGRQRKLARARGRVSRAPARRAARHPGPQGGQAFVRYPGVRRLHRAGRRPG